MYTHSCSMLIIRNFIELKVETAFELTQQCRSTPPAQVAWQNSSGVYPLNTWTHTDYWHMNRNPKSQYTNTHTLSSTPLEKFSIQKWKNVHRTQWEWNPCKLQTPLRGDSSQGLLRVTAESGCQHGYKEPKLPSIPGGSCIHSPDVSVQKPESRCPRCWGRVRSPAVENRGSGTESSFPSSCSRWETTPPGRLRHKWYTASSPTGSWAGRSPWTWSGWTTGPDLRVWGSGGPGVTTGGSTWSLRVGPLRKSSDIRRDATQSQIPCVSVRD